MVLYHQIEENRAGPKNLDILDSRLTTEDVSYTSKDMFKSPFETMEILGRKLLSRDCLRHILTQGKHITRKR